jgi:hypothetical protein
LQAVGVVRDTQVWVAVVQYPVATTYRDIQLFRPTQLEAGSYPYHFPSPPQAELAKGGFTMFLNQPAPEKRYIQPALVSEYVHAQVDFTIKNWRSAGGLVDVTKRPVAGALQDQRRRHWELLGTRYGPTLISEWMPINT